MNVAATNPNPKFHGPAPMHNAETVSHGVSTNLSNHNIKSSIDGEVHDMPGGHSAQMATVDYGEGRHTAYDSPLAQPAYSGHGKVKTGSTSAL